MNPSEKKKKTLAGNIPELLAPAGSLECLQAAIQAGADAIYFGAEQLNMRTKSSHSFTLEDIASISQICRKANIKSYLTLNTIIYDHDVRLMQELVKAAKDSGLTAIIGSDQAVLNYCKRLEMPVHISTQCNISNIEAVAFYATYADAVVLARELTLTQIKEIIREIRRRKITGPSGELIKIEVFAHGALCMAVSGKCYLSLHSHNASANRGACTQDCRKSYMVTDRENGIELAVDGEYIMSAKDLCTIDFLDKLTDAGVAILKIEGRGRSVDYVYTATQCYREALNSLQKGNYNSSEINKWKEKLSTVFNRGFWEGYYLGKEVGEWSKSDGSLATQRKIYIAKGMKYFSQRGVGEFLMESHDLKVCDRIMITGPTTGYIETIIDELRVDGKPALQAKKGDLISIRIHEKIRPSDRLYKIVSATDH